MPDREDVVDDLNFAKLILCSPQMLTSEMRIRIGQAITRAISFLKEEQEPVEPTKGQSQIFPENIEYYCGKCGAVVGVYDKIRRHWDVRMKYCYKCGRKVKWG